MMKIKIYISVLVVFILFSTSLFSQEIKKDTINKWYKPTHCRLQYAGNIGMLSAGPSWSLFKKNLELTYSIGYSPEFATGSNIFTTSFKCYYTPKLNINIKDKVIIKPISIGSVVSHTFGEEYSRYQNTDMYPVDYYWWKTPYMNALVYEAQIHSKINGKNIKGVSLYFEVSLWDLYLFSLYDNSNITYLNLWDISTFGIGTKIYFQ